MARRSIVTLSRNALSSYLIVRLVCSDTSTQPFPVCSGCRPQHPFANPKEVRKAESPVVHVLGRIQQRFNQFIPLLRVVAFQELPCSIGWRQRSRQVEADSTQKFGIARE